MYSQPPAPTGIPPSNMPPPPLQPRGSWSTGLCDCFLDMKSCLLTWLCPCITFGRIAEIVDQGNTSCVTSGAIYMLIMFCLGCPHCYSCCYREKLRHQFGLPPSPCGDGCVHCCCESCALCQEYRELQNRGYDLSLGWQGNVERQNRGGLAMPPMVHGGMSK